MSPPEGDVALACMRVFAESLVAWGLSDACVSPGSRSTPLALALARTEGVRLHVHLDERASAFFALGLVKVTGRPAAVACTSGTAAAELLPAVVEASMARVPMLVLTADRPDELRGVGANQTIEQRSLYGSYVRWAAEAEVPGDRPEAGPWSRLAADAWTQSIRHPPGPIHVNLPFREPLVPTGAGVDLGPIPPAFPDALGGASPPEDADVEAVRDLVTSTERGLVLAGSLRQDAREVVELAHRAAWPLLAEPTSGLRVPGSLEAGQFLLSSATFASDHVPEVVLQVGAAPTSRAGLALVGRCERLVIADPDDLVADPHRRAERRLVVDVAELAGRALARTPQRPETDWLRSWREADARARAAVDRLVDGWSEPAEGRVARDLAGMLPEGTTLFVGSSMPVRDLDASMHPRLGLRVLANRGASGIDGLVSTALGVAAAASDPAGAAPSPAAAMIGDLSLLHDVGSLLWSGRRGANLVLVVPNNGGGAIFSFLPQRDLPELERLFTTPHGLDLAAVCAAAGVEHALVVQANDLQVAVEQALAAGGVHVVEVAVDARSNVARHAEVQTAVDAALGGGPGAAS